MRRLLIMAGAAGLAAAGGGLAIAARPDDEPPPSGLAVQVRAPEQLPAQGPTGVRSATDPDLPPASAAGRRVLRQVDAEDGRVAQVSGGTSLHLARRTDGQICLSVVHDATEESATSCQPPAEVARGSLSLGDRKRFSGAVPDTVRSVLVTEGDGRSSRVPVVGNTYTVAHRAGVVRVEWSSPEGARADMRLPPAP